MSVLELRSISDQRVFASAIRHLKSKDPVLGNLIQKHGRIKFTPDEDIFTSLVYSIISQQLSSKAADAIAKRVTELFPAGKLNAPSLAKVRVQRLRKAGLSLQKISYLRDLCSRMLDGSLDFELLKDKDDSGVLEKLDEIRGVGPWTAKMILIFCLGRPDVFAFEDVGLQGAIKKLYSLSKPPDKMRMEQLSVSWHPFCSVASLYLWKDRDSSRS